MAAGVDAPSKQGRGLAKSVLRAFYLVTNRVNDYNCHPHYFQYFGTCDQSSYFFELEPTK